MVKGKGARAESKPNFLIIGNFTERLQYRTKELNVIVNFINKYHNQF